jgi:acyl-CoA synthetase (NDP forming)
MTRHLYRHAALRRLIEPSSIAIVGATGRAGAFGYTSITNLSTYKGRLYLVNARYDEIEGKACFSSLAALPEVPDCVILAVPRDKVEEAVIECARLRVGGVVIFASGYAELGTPSLASDQNRLVEIARESGMPLVGPNCMGITNYLNGAAITFATGPMCPRPRPDSIGLVSQSGALSFALVQAIEHGVSFSHALSAGNSADVDVADYVAYLAEDDGCKAIACTFEGLEDPTRLMEAAGIALARRKPVVVFKIATGEQGAAAAMSHTGSLAGSNEAYRAAFERAGIIVVDEFEDLIATASFLAKSPPPIANGVAVVTTSGGAGIMAADKAEQMGIPLPQPTQATEAALIAALPHFGSPRNPCDVTAAALNDLDSFRLCVEALLDDHQYGAMIVPVVGASDSRTPRIPVLDEVAKARGKAACLVWLSQWMEGPGSRVAEECERVAIFRSMRSCFAALAHWQWWWKRVEQPIQKIDTVISSDVRDAVHQKLLSGTSIVLSESQAKDVLSTYGIPVVREMLATTADETVAAAIATGFPVVLKVESSEIPHKTEAGVVRLGLADEQAVRLAYTQIMSNALQIVQPSAVRGVLVQPMVGKGVEVLVGARIDLSFGPTVVVGMGGILVELLNDSAVALAPLSHAEALQTLRRLKGFRLLEGFRGSEPVDVGRLADIVCRVAQFASDHRDQISEIDLNPLICTGGRIIAVDALISLQEPSIQAHHSS